MIDKGRTFEVCREPDRPLAMQQLAAGDALQRRHRRRDRIWPYWRAQRKRAAVLGMVPLGEVPALF